MPRTARQLSGSSIYHVMLRGVNREAIFREQADLERFVSLLTIVRRVSGCRILAYCLMPNHVHLIAQTTDEPIGLVMKRLGVRYAGWFNRKYDRVGHLFQDRFKSKPVEDDGYLTTLLRYVWDNPVSAGLAARPEDYPWSSRHYLGSQVPWLDEPALRELVAAETLTAIAAGACEATTEPSIEPDSFTDQDAVRLLERICGAANVGEFALLDRSKQWRALRTLQDEGLSLRARARVTGLTVASVRWRESRHELI